MPKGYWVVRVDITRPDDYPRYVAANAAPIAAYGGRFIIRGGQSEMPEGKGRSRNVVVEFPSYEAARGCYYSDGYQAAVKLRKAAAESDFLIIEGYDGPQPGD
jgi:uncharacterized protein (DUF1330 family)